MTGSEIENAVNCVQTQGVEMVVLKPIQCILDEESPHFVAASTVKVDGLTPRGPVAIGKVWSVSIKVVAFRPQMVVNHVERDG